MAICSTAHAASALKLEQIVGISIFGMKMVDIVGDHVGDFHHLSWSLMISQSALLKFCFQTEKWFQIPGAGTDAAREALKIGTCTVALQLHLFRETWQNVMMDAEKT